MLTLDPTTRAEFDAAPSSQAKATVVVQALAAPVQIKVYSDPNTVVGIGTMSEPWATVSNNILTIGQLSSFAVTDSGTPDSNWFLRFESGDRYLQGTFALADADFTWSLPTWEAAQQGQVSQDLVTVYPIVVAVEDNQAAEYDVFEATPPIEPENWQLISEHYVAAKMPPVIIHPRPNTETYSWERHRMCPEGISWRIPITLQGGAWPFNVEVLNAPVGMTASLVRWSNGSPKYWVLNWPSPTSVNMPIGGWPITIRVRTQDYGRQPNGRLDSVWGEQSVDFTLSVFDKNDTTKFLWMDIINGRKWNESVLPGLGTYDRPFKHFNDWYRTNAGTSFVGRQVFYREGTYPFTNGAELSPGVFDMTLNQGNLKVDGPTTQGGVQAPLVHIGFPGEQVVWNCSDPIDATSNLNYGGKWFSNKPSNGLFVANIRMQNARQDVSNAHFFWLGGRTNERRITLFEDYFYNIKPGLVGNDNTSVMFGSIVPATGRGKYYSFVGNTYDTFFFCSNGVSMYDLYFTDYIVVEGCTQINCASQYAYWSKSLNGEVTIRSSQATMTDGRGAFVIAAAVSPNAGRTYSGNAEVCWNIIDQTNQLKSGVSAYSDADSTSTDPYWVYKNTILGLFGIDSKWAPQTVDHYNVWVIPNTKTTQYSGQTPSVTTPNIVSKRQDNILNADFTLTDAALIAKGTSRGIYGHEVI